MEQAVAALCLKSRLANASTQSQSREIRWRFCAYLRFSRYGASAYCVWANRDKQSICGDLKEPTDADAL